MPLSRLENWRWRDYCLSEMPNLRTTPSWKGVTRYTQDPWFFKKMLEKNPNIDAHGGNRGCALHIAIEEDCEEAAWLLLSRNPYLDAVSGVGSILAAAIDKGMIDLASLTSSLCYWRRGRMSTKKRETGPQLHWRSVRSEKSW